MLPKLRNHEYRFRDLSRLSWFTKIDTSARQFLTSTKKQPSVSDYLFVYGTLKRGFNRARFLNSAEFIGEAATEPRYRLYNCGEYPGLVESHDGLSIRGELYRFSPLRWELLDEVEGVDSGLYRRVFIRLQPPHERLRVQTYLYELKTDRMPDCGESWP